MNTLPRLALSVRQPWAWAIIHGGKDIENRTWQAVNHGLRQRGRIAIHASKGLTRDEYESASDFMLSQMVACPEPHELLRGGIIGSVGVVDVVSESESPWFFGPRGLVLRDPQPCEFVPAIGALGYFEWKPADASVAPAPARWMLPEEQREEQPRAPRAPRKSAYADNPNLELFSETALQIGDVTVTPAVGRIRS